MNKEQIEAETVQRHIVRCLSGGANMGWISAPERANIESWLASATASEGRIAELTEALRFYGDSKRYNGSNQRLDGHDPYTPKGDVYLRDIGRDGGEIARAALAGSATPSAAPVTPKHIEEIKDILLWPVTEDDARAARDMLQSLHFDLSMAESGAGSAAAPAPQDMLKNTDSERLDWLDKQGVGYGFEGELEGYEWVMNGPFGTIREAIDAARTAAIESERATLKENKNG